MDSIKTKRDHKDSCGIKLGILHEYVPERIFRPSNVQQIISSVERHVSIHQTTFKLQQYNRNEILNMSVSKNFPQLLRNFFLLDEIQKELPKHEQYEKLVKHPENDQQFFKRITSKPFL